MGPPHVNTRRKLVNRMIYLHVSPITEIASQLDVPVKTLYTRLDRAKAQLRVALQRVEDAR